MELNSDFEKFLTEIRPQQNHKTDLQNGHLGLRTRLSNDENLSQHIVSTFLQGSYKRSTAIRPKLDRRADVDIVVVTNLSENQYTPRDALSLFHSFLDSHYKGKWRPQGRSFGIAMSSVDLDLVITSAPTESDIDILKSDALVVDDDIESAKDWKLSPSWRALNNRLDSNTRQLLSKAVSESEWTVEPLRIPDRDTNQWESTHPIEQIRWTRDKNTRCGGNFINVVKALKWWRVEKYLETEHPKGFPLERLIGECCPDNISSIAEGITLTLEAIVSNYTSTYRPNLPDYGVPEHDVFKRISNDDFLKFYNQVCHAAIIARRALDSSDRVESANLWRELFGNKFPKPPEGGSPKKSGYTMPEEPAMPGSGRFA